MSPALLFDPMVVLIGWRLLALFRTPRPPAIPDEDTPLDSRLETLGREPARAANRPSPDGE